MNNVKAPYSVNSLTSQEAIKALKSTDSLRKNVAKVLKERDRVREELNKKDFVVRVCESHANFLLFQLKSDAKEIYQVGLAHAAFAVTVTVAAAIM